MRTNCLDIVEAKKERNGRKKRVDEKDEKKKKEIRMKFEEQLC